MTKNYTSAAVNTAVSGAFASGAAAIEPIVNAVVPDAAVDPAKWNATTTLMNNIGDAVAGPLNDAAFLANLNSQLAQYNIQVTAKSVSAPTKFSNAAAVIARAATGKGVFLLFLFLFQSFFFLYLFQLDFFVF